MIREIKTTLAIDGEKKFKDALAEAGREMRVMNADLKAMSAEFKATDDAQRYYAQRSETLNSKVRQQEEIVEALTKAVKESAEAYGDTARQTDEYRIKLSNATAKLFDMRREAEQAKNELENLGNAKIDADFKQAIEEANRSLKLSRSEAKLLGVSYRNNAEDADYLAKRSQNLKEQIAAAEKIYVETAEAMKRSAAATGELSDETVNLKIRTNEARIELTNLRRESEQVNRDLEELGRDSGKIGRQIERGIGDVAEDTADKLDGMFDKVAKDVNALKSNVAFQTTMNVGGFVFDSIQSIMGFADEHQEYNRKLSQARTVIEMYGYNWDEVDEIIRHATGVIGDRDTAQSAIVNLAGAGFESEKQIAATVENLLGIYTSSGGDLDFNSLAGDYLESVKEKTPTGTFAEAIIKFTNRSVEDVQKVLENAKSHADTLEIATGILTEAGLQNKSKNWVEENKDLYNAELAKQDLAKAWGDLALEIAPVVTALVSGTTTLVDGLTTIINKIKEIPFLSSIIETLAIENAFKAAADKAAEEAERLRREGQASEEEVQKATEYAETQKAAAEAVKKFGRLNSFRETMGTFLSPKDVIEEIEAEGGWGAWLKNIFIPPKEAYPELIPSAGAETLPTTELEGYGAEAWQEIANGMMTASESNPAVDAAIKTALAEMKAEDVTEAANLSGKNLMIEFGNGIATGAEIPLQNVRDLVAQINATLAGIATPAFGLGWGGISGGSISLYQYHKGLAREMSKIIGSDVRNTILKK